MAKRRSPRAGRWLRRKPASARRSEEPDGLEAEPPAPGETSVAPRKMHTAHARMRPAAGEPCAAAASPGDDRNAGDGIDEPGWFACCDAAIRELMRWTYLAAVEPLLLLFEPFGDVALVPVGQFAWLPLATARTDDRAPLIAGRSVTLINATATPGGGNRHRYQKNPDRPARRALGPRSAPSSFIPAEPPDADGWS